MKLSEETRGIARLSTLSGQERHIFSFFLIILMFSPIFPQFFLIFFLNLVLCMGGQEGPGYTTGRDYFSHSCKYNIKGCRMGRSDKVSLWYVSLLINTRFRFFILE